MELSDIKIKKILYATDLSESAVHAFSYAVSLANVYDASITILHVLSEFPGEEFITNMIDPGTWKKIKTRHYDEAWDQLIDTRRDHVALREVLEVFSEEAKNNSKGQDFVTDEILIKTGVPAETIVQTAKQRNCDLIVVGTHGQGIIKDFLIGSTAKWVLRHSTIPVFVIRLP